MKIFVCVKHVPDTAANVKLVDAMTTAEALKKAVEQDGSAPMILTGKQYLPNYTLDVEFQGQSSILPV